ncbi:tetratricopeptide repeat protein [Sphingomonas bacterium]|uniref:tetratricopeptide repeat protein n=1 Tax=Sphingomonas bacterium TaxID=1895847 RepID=UPI0020C70E44|nr:tetratricopeptide repeat protein [Sphingomonas bacterium]
MAAKPPVTPPTDQAFLREVDDELRRDQLLGFWRRWGRALVAAIVGGLALFAGFLFWQHRREAAAGSQGEQLTQAYDALGNRQFGAAMPPLAALAGSNRDGYRAMATFSQADILLQQNNAAGAAAKFAGLASDASLAKPFRDLALIRQTAAEYDRLKPQVIVERLRPLAVAGSPWLGSAGELLAAAYLREGRRDLAATLFGQMAQGDDVPPTLRQRAVQMAGVLGVDTATPDGEAKAK